MNARACLPFIVGFGLLCPAPLPAAEIPGFRASPWFQEQVREEWLAEGVRVWASASRNFDTRQPSRIIFYATPNGNTIEQTLGCAPTQGLDWRHDIQHIAAQMRLYRDRSQDPNLVLVCLEAEELSWPAWKKKRSDGPAVIRRIVQRIREWIPSREAQLTLACHSGGGSFLLGYIDGGDAIPDDVARLIILDANYSYSDRDRHDEKMLHWLKADGKHRLIVLAYDDRNIQLDGKPVIGPDGGTFRATERMREHFARQLTFDDQVNGEWRSRTAMKGQIALKVHENPGNRILHTAMIGEMNGFLHSLAYGEPDASWSKLGAPRTYSAFVQPAPGVPPRPRDAITGTQFFEMLGKRTLAEREEAIADEINRGNIPDFLRRMQRMTIRGKDSHGIEHTLVFEVFPDYLAIGSDENFVRVPMSPLTAARIADVYGCSLPTRKLVNDIYSLATVKLAPRPLTHERESPATFLQHHLIIEEQRTGRKLGECVAGIKKDLVVSNRLEERVSRVAIYGWHQLDGKPIQPLNVSHVHHYVDYSHGVRLIRRVVHVDGKPHDLRRLLGSSLLHPLVSDEGLIRRPTY